MVTRKINSEIESEETPIVAGTVSTGVDMSAIMKMLEEQQKTIDTLKDQILKQGAITPKTSTENTYDPNRIVAVVNMYDGESLTLKIGHNGEGITLYGYGDKQYFRYEVAANMARMNRTFASKGYFIFEDADIIRDFGLEKDYVKFIDKQILDKLDTLDSKSLEALYERSNTSYKDMIFDKFVKGYIEGIKGLRDVDKVEALSRIRGVDVQYTIDELQKAKRMKNQ